MKTSECLKKYVLVFFFTESGVEGNLFLVSILQNVNFKFNHLIFFMKE